MENIKEELQKYLPDVEKFLTSVLLEETKIEVVSSKNVEQSSALEDLQKTDIFLYTRAQEFQSDCIIILDKEWYGLLSSIMLGVEEKSDNEVTRDLLKKFSSELVANLVNKMERNGLKPNPEEMQVLSFKQVEDNLAHSEYYRAGLDIEGLADDSVRAELLIGYPEPEEQQQEEAEQETEAIDEETKQESETGEETEQEPVAAGKKGESQTQETDQQNSPDEPQEEEEFSSVDAEEMEKLGTEEEVISGRSIEFDDFEEPGNGNYNGDSRSMDLLKDVEMDVAVELGRIELPLGKVLQLAKGSVIELEKLAGEPVDILVNGHRIAHGEVVVIDEHFGVRIANLITTRQRIAQLK